MFKVKQHSHEIELERRNNYLQRNEKLDYHNLA